MFFLSSQTDIAPSERRSSLTNLRRLYSVPGTSPVQKRHSIATTPNRRQVQDLSQLKCSQKKNSKIKGPAVVDEMWREVEIDGWKSLTKTKSSSVRIFWCLILLSCLGIGIRGVINVCVEYYGSPLSTSYDVFLNYTEGMAFPHIDIIPTNSMNWSMVSANHSFLDYAFCIRQDYTETKNYSNYPQHPNGTFNWYWNATPTILQAKEDILKFGYSADQFMPECRFSQSSTNFVNCIELVVAKIIPGYGKYFTLDLENTTQTNANLGLEIIFNLHKKLYPPYHKNLNPPVAPRMEGVRLEVGFETILLRPGSHYKIDIMAEHVVLINFHRGNTIRMCIESGENEFEYKVLNRNSGNYTQQSCELDCYIREIWEHCECLQLNDPFYIKNEILHGMKKRSIICDPVKTETCIRHQIDNNKNIQKSVETCRKSCFNPCVQTRYQVKVSDAPLYQPSYQTLLDWHNTTIDNIIKVELSYPRLGYTQIEQRVSKSFEDLVSDLGGQFNLWLGASMVTVIQIPFLLVTLCFYKSYHQGRRATVTVVRAARSLTRMDE